jgi:glucose/arabinose dehydrogenase
MKTWAISAFLGALALAPAPGYALSTSQGEVRVQAMLSGLDEPWAIGLLPDGGFLVSEREGRLLHVRDGEARAVAGVPQVAATGQGGLLDITVARDFATTREIFLSFAMPQARGQNTALAVARLSENGAALEDLRVIFEAAPGFSGGRHFGSRVVEAPDGTLFLTTGDRGQPDSSQDLSNHNGAVIRVARDGSVPPDNPFVGQAGVRPEIWSYGHRNVQGAGLDLSGNLITAEHGARGGDEVNRVKRGANFGWPVITYGVAYSGARIGEGTEKPGMEQPEFYWDPSMAPSGLMVYSGKLWPEWRGDIFVGSLKFGYIARLDGAPLAEVERIEGDETGRIRDIVEAGDGAIWFLSVGEGAVYRMTPG